MRIDWKGGFLLIAITLIMFYLSPFSEVHYPTKCYGFGLSNNSAGAQAQPICGKLITEKDYAIATFPFKEDKRISFCKKNIEGIEQSCNMSIYQLIVEDYFDDYFTCNYFFKNENDSTNILRVNKHIGGKLPPQVHEDITMFESQNAIISIYSLRFRHTEKCHNIKNVIKD